MNCNVMSRHLTRRLGACANIPPKTQQGHFSTATARPQSRNVSQQLKDNVALLQEEDRRLLLPVKASIDSYLESLAGARKTLDRLPVALGPERAERVLASSAALEEKLRTLRGHIADMAVEPYPDFGGKADDVMWETRVQMLGPRERDDELFDVDVSARNTAEKLAEMLRNLKAERGPAAADADDAPPEVAKRIAPLPPASMKMAAGAKVKEMEDRSAKFGLGARKEREARNAAEKAKAKVKAGEEAKVKRREEEARPKYGVWQDKGDFTSWKPTPSAPAPQKPRDRSPPPPGDKSKGEKAPNSDLLSLQARLEKSWRNS
ncbi:hypothetical protein WHR41_01965 [Cladosporium halotolerans]|uniref:Uncharacterized protein n=1 Tax=Cladosporium halotolerans TaxID=1052096 RepID=A0AB34L1Z4_9PEZI